MGSRGSDGWVPVRASPDRLRANAVKSDWLLSQPARIEGRWGDPNTQRKPPGRTFEPPVLDWMTSVHVGVPHSYAPHTAPSQGEGSVRGEKMLGCGRHEVFAAADVEWRALCAPLLKKKRRSLTADLIEGPFVRDTEPSDAYCSGPWETASAGLGRVGLSRAQPSKTAAAPF